MGLISQKDLPFLSIGRATERLAGKTKWVLILKQHTRSLGLPEF